MYYYSPMMGNYDWGWGVLMMVLWLLAFAVFTTVVIRIFRSSSSVIDQRTSPIDIVKERYAKGEITKEQFETLSKDLQ